MVVSPATNLLQEGLALHRRGAAAEAAARYAEVLRADPGNADAHYYLGMMACQQDRYADGAEHARQALANDPRHERACVLLGRALAAMGRPQEALESFDRAVALAPDLAQAHGHRADLLSELGRHAEAVDSYDRALALAPEAADDWYNRGASLVALRRHAEALASFDRAVAARPDFTDAHLQRAKLLSDFDRPGEALDAVDRVLAVAPDLPEAWLGRGNVLNKLRRRAEAAAAFDRALALKPDLAEAWLGRANGLFASEHNEAAAFAYGKAIALKPDLNGAEGYRIYAKLKVCDWEGLDHEVAQHLHAIRARQLAGAPFTLLAVSTSAADQLQCARRHVQEQPKFPAVWRGEAYSHRRIRVAYLSADFHDHAVGQLTAQLFERHDRSRFEVTGLSLGADRNSQMRRRFESAFEHFVDVEDKSDQDIAELIRRLEIDVAVDLMGFTTNNRLDVLARRPAPIQVNYLGYLGTLGADFMDYVIGDRIALPFEQQPFFTERIVHLPDCFLPTDDRQEIAPFLPTRLQAGLPAEGFVFCSFNNSYKLNRAMFALWMRILRAVPGSVLWLAQANAAMVANLRREARQSGVEPERIVFAPLVPLTEHMARQRLAGLFLDTTPYNAGATAVASLWSGVPLLTVLGETFVGRMAASMLHAVGLPELVARNLDAYEALAIKLASEPALLADIRGRLAADLRTKPLFDTARFRRNIEQAYIAMVDIHRRGERPRSFSVEPA
jgi:protein O-GlcNAc transferase